MNFLRSAALVGAALGFMSHGSIAADLGGNCCADLEERIAELEATTARKGNRKVSLFVYGQLNQAVMYWDDSTEQNTYVVNNKTTTTHFGFEGSADVMPEVRAGFRIEIEPANANSDFVDQGPVQFGVVNADGVGDDGRAILVTRHANWWLEHKKLGRVTVGLQSNATDNIAEMDLSKTEAISLSSVETWNEGFFIRDQAGGGILVPGILSINGVGISIMGDLYRGNLDGGRGNLVRYDTPVIAGFIASVAWGEDDDFDVGLRYLGKIGDFKVKAGIGYQNGKIVDTDNLIANLGANGANVIQDFEKIAGSLALLHEPTGLFFTGAAGTRNWLESPAAGLDLLGEDYYYLKGGILRNWLPLGSTSLYGEFYHISDVGIEVAGSQALTDRFDETAKMWGIGVVQHVDNAAMELYLAYRHYYADDITGFDANGLNLVDSDIEMDMVMSGARIKF